MDEHLLSILKWILTTVGGLGGTFLVFAITRWVTQTSRSVNETSQATNKLKTSVEVLYNKVENFQMSCDKTSAMVDRRVNRHGEQIDDLEKTVSSHATVLKEHDRRLHKVES